MLHVCDLWSKNPHKWPPLFSKHRHHGIILILCECTSPPIAVFCASFVAQLWHLRLIWWYYTMISYPPHKMTWYFAFYRSAQTLVWKHRPFTTIKAPVTDTVMFTAAMWAHMSLVVTEGRVYDQMLPAQYFLTIVHKHTTDSSPDSRFLFIRNLIV